MAQGFVLVKFCVDEKQMKRPASFVKDFKPEEFVPGQKHLVFWSPKTKDSPESVLLSQGRILHMDSIEEKKRNDGNAEPLAGYYSATVLRFASSEKELDLKVVEKRTIVPTSKKKQELEEKIRKPALQKPVKSRISKAKQKKVIAKGETLTLQEYEPRKTPSPTYSSTSDELTPRKPYIKKLNELEKEGKKYKRKYHDCHKKYSECKEEILRLKEENENLRMKRMKDDEVRMKGVNACTPVKHCASPGIRRSPRKAETPRKIPYSLQHVENHIEHKDATDCKQTVVIDCEQNVAFDFEQKVAIDFDQTVIATDFEKKVTTVSEQKDSTHKVENGADLKEAVEEKELKLNVSSSHSETEMVKQTQPKIPAYVKGSYDHFISDNGKKQKILWRVRYGEPGDSQFTKNLASAVYTNQVLMISSVTGTRALNQAGSIARPKLNEDKFELLKQMFLTRMEGENPVPTPQEKNDRLAKIGFYVDQKIQTLRRPARTAEPAKNP